MVFLIAGPARADDLQKQLNSEYADKVLTLRRFYEGNHLKFLSDGRLVGDAPVGPWTVDSRVEIKQIHAKNCLIEIKGRRIHLAFDSTNLSGGSPAAVDQLTTLGSLSGKNRDEVEKYLRKLEVKIEIEISSGKPDEHEIDSTIHAVFIMPGESMIEAVPPYWRRYFAKLEGRPQDQPVPAGPMARIVRGGSISPPRPIHAPDPDYSDDARKSRYQGTVVVWLIVGPDGAPRDLQIERPLGLGLDEKAIDTISKWKFEPAKKDGNPVAVQIDVEVSFRLY